MYTGGWNRSKVDCHVYRRSVVDEWASGGGGDESGSGGVGPVISADMGLAATCNQRTLRMQVSPRWFCILRLKHLDPTFSTFLRDLQVVHDARDKDRYIFLSWVACANNEHGSQPEPKKHLCDAMQNFLLNRPDRVAPTEPHSILLSSDRARVGELLVEQQTGRPPRRSLFPIQAGCGTLPLGHLGVDVRGHGIDHGGASSYPQVSKGRAKQFL
jgi:hypothetical protein